MKRNDDIYYKAYTSRDPRFDGKFFCGVKTTGIYCRPICPAKPKRENVVFFLNALDAERSGFRPCLRCRPECAPGSGGWIGKSSTVKRGLSLIESQVLLDKNEEEFSSLLGLSARHLRRLFLEELGQTPKQISDLYRLNFSRKLVLETSLSITEIAHTSGFSSIRRFNEAFKSRFHRSPTEIRKGRMSPASETFKLRLSYRPPYDFHGLLSYYKNHIVEGVEVIQDGFYQRSFRIDETLGRIRIVQGPESNELILEIDSKDPRALYQIVQKARHLFDVDSDPMIVEEAFAKVPLMKQLIKKYPGQRFARGWDPFETSVCAILGQLVSVKQARSLVKELVENYGEKLLDSSYLFPTPSTLATATLSELRTTEKRKETIRKFSELVLGKELSLHHAQDPEAFKEKIREIPGIGPWTAEYIALRALGDSDAFPATDLVLKKFAKEKVQGLRPWRGHAAFYLWRDYASKKEVL